MKKLNIIINRQEEIQVKNLAVTIGKSLYRIYESVDGKLCINKSTEEEDGSLIIFPRYSNEIELK